MIRCRRAEAGDASAVAALHVDSWRRHYRGAYSAAFLDGDVAADRSAVWSQRLGSPDPDDRTVIAEDGGELVGFAHVVLDEDPKWGALVDNLHVVHSRKRSGIGTQLLKWAGRSVADEATQSRLYLWVLEQNTAAQAFYRSLGGVCADRKEVSPPGGDLLNLDGSPLALRVAWSDANVLGHRYLVDPAR